MYNTAIRQLNICQTTLGMLAIRNGLAVAPTYDSEECVLQSRNLFVLPQHAGQILQVIW